MSKIKKIGGYDRIAPLTELDDPEVMTIRDFIRKLKSMAKDYGADTLIELNAGYNNIECFMVKRQVKWQRHKM